MNITAFDIRKFLTTPAAPTVTPTLGTASTWTYVWVAVDEAGAPLGDGETHSAKSANGSTAAGAATLDGTHFNTVTGAVVPGATRYDLYRTVCATSPTTIGKIGSTTDPVTGIVDNGLAGDAAVPPTTSNSGVGGSIPARGKDKSIQIYGTFVGTLQAQGSLDDENWFDVDAAKTAPALYSFAPTLLTMRMKMTAYTSGTPEAKLGER